MTCSPVASFSHNKALLSYFRSLIQIKSHAQKVLKSDDDIFRRLDEHKTRVELLVARAHARLGGEPFSTTPSRRRRPFVRKEEDYEDDNSANEYENEVKKKAAKNVEQQPDAAANPVGHVTSTIQNLVTAAEFEQENSVSKPEPRNLAAEQESFYSSTNDEPAETKPKSRSTYLDAASALCQLVHKDGDDRPVEDRIDTSATIGLAPTPMKTMAEASQV